MNDEICLPFCRHLGVSGADIWRSGQQVYVLGSRSVTPACLRTSGLSPRQTKFCQLYPDHMASVGRGAQMAIAECQWQFRNRRWNCTTVNDNSVFGPVIDRGKPRKTTRWSQIVPRPLSSLNVDQFSQLLYR